MSKDEFNSCDVESQVSIINDFISTLGSLRKACESIGIAKTTVRDRFSKSGYVLVDNKYVFDSSKLIVKTISDVSVSDDVLLERYVKVIQSSLNSIVNNFFVVGETLFNIQDKRLYKVLGYDSLMIFSLDKFNLSRNQTYNFINIYKKFSDKKFGDFKYSQLTEMLSLPEDKVNEVTPDMTIKEIREVKRKTKSTDVGTKRKKSDNYVSVDNQEEDSPAEEYLNVQSVLKSIVDTLNIEWSKAENNDYADGLNRAISVINGFLS